MIENRPLAASANSAFRSAARTAQSEIGRVFECFKSHGARIPRLFAVSVAPDEAANIPPARRRRLWTRSGGAL